MSCLSGGAGKYGLKLNESIKVNILLDLSRKLKIQLNMWVIVIQIAVGVLETVQKGMKKRLEELEIKVRIKAIQATTY